MNKFKIKVYYCHNRNQAIYSIVKSDPEAIIKVLNRWGFKVMTKLTSNQITKILTEDLENTETFLIKKTLFF